MFYILQNDKIVLYDENRAKLADTLEFMPQYNDLPILETDRPIVDFEFADTPEWIANHLREVKETKMKEALDGAKLFIENEACYQFDENNSIEATDGNIGKLTAYALGFSTGTMQEVQWTSKEDNVLTLDPDDLNDILIGIGAIQSFVWNVQYIQYKQTIETATTAEEVESIEIVYTDIIPNEQQD